MPLRSLQDHWHNRPQSANHREPSRTRVEEKLPGTLVYIYEAQSTSPTVPWCPGPVSVGLSMLEGGGTGIGDREDWRPPWFLGHKLDSIGLGNLVESGASKAASLDGHQQKKHTGCTIERLPGCQSFGEYKDAGSGSPRLFFLTSSSIRSQATTGSYRISSISFPNQFPNPRNTLNSHPTSSHILQLIAHVFTTTITYKDNNMLAIQTLSLVAFLAFASAYDLPLTMMSPTPTTSGQLTARSFFPAQFIPGQLSGGEHTAGTISAGAGPASASCGLESNVWGQVSPVSSSGYANLCLQCRVNVFGVDVFEFNFYSALSASISAHGVSANQCSVLQSAIEGDLLKLAAGSKTSASCTAACKGDERCDSCSFNNGVCQIQAVDYVKQNHAGAPLAQAFQGLYSNGGSGYCSICPADRSCAGPTPSGLPRRSLAVEDSPANDKCPAGLSACPISSGMTLKPSAGFECLDLQQEVTSCGGCASTGQGVDCTTLKGVSSSGCTEGKCKIFSCKSGYQYSSVHNLCYKSHRSSKFNSTSR
ncbi:hypothetical protein Pst134EA_022926 [Puccinia striiformis f. sp. tritici]|uniref:hypothetical protein n=1 Tax=Puccinia striiformis f. sp. tritici TaxID=168172 RepID=UPI0020088876|nr:hypothetical protein Pst134EA_022926 [Puccinia striiformis f. sp. tritici]KAH9455463.1 hypothetical protein Pst134EA_022926 [Puccinia striiformis f. sp. tritici]